MHLGQLAGPESDGMGRGAEEDVPSPRKCAMPVACPTVGNGGGLLAGARMDKSASEGWGRKGESGACKRRDTVAQSNGGGRVPAELT